MSSHEHQCIKSRGVKNFSPKTFVQKRDLELRMWGWENLIIAITQYFIKSLAFVKKNTFYLDYIHIALLVFTIFTVSDILRP